MRESRYRDRPSHPRDGTKMAGSFGNTEALAVSLIPEGFGLCPPARLPGFVEFGEAVFRAGASESERPLPRLGGRAAEVAEMALAHTIGDKVESRLSARRPVPEGPAARRGMGEVLCCTVASRPNSADSPARRG
jgi:hypothetical protein